MGEGSPVKHYDLRTGTYGVAVTIGKSFQTRLQEGSETIGGILEGNPALMPLLGATYFRFRNEPGMKEIAKILKKVREKEYPGIDRDDDAQQGPPPEVLQQQIQQAQQMLEMAQQEIATLKQQAEADTVKAQALLQKAQIDASVKLEIERLSQEHAERLQGMKDATTIEVAKINALTKQVVVANQAENEAQALGMEHAHAEHMAGMSAERESATEDGPAETDMD